MLIGNELVGELHRDNSSTSWEVRFSCFSGIPDRRTLPEAAIQRDHILHERKIWGYIFKGKIETISVLDIYFQKYAKNKN